MPLLHVCSMPGARGKRRRGESFAPASGFMEATAQRGRAPAFLFTNSSIFERVKDQLHSLRTRQTNGVYQMVGGQPSGSIPSTERAARSADATSARAACHVANPDGRSATSTSSASPRSRQHGAAALVALDLYGPGGTSAETRQFGYGQAVKEQARGLEAPSRAQARIMYRIRVSQVLNARRCAVVRRRPKSHWKGIGRHFLRGSRLSRRWCRSADPDQVLHVTQGHDGVVSRSAIPQAMQLPLARRRHGLRHKPAKE